jgi:hypothetical protein
MTDAPSLTATFGLRSGAGWPAPDDPGGDDDAELDRRDLIFDRLLDEVGLIRPVRRLASLPAHQRVPPAVNLRPDGDHLAAGRW